MSFEPVPLECKNRVSLLNFSQGLKRIEEALDNSRRFEKILDDSGNLLEDSGRIWKILEDPRRF